VSVTKQEVLAALGRVKSVRQQGSIVEAGMVEEVKISGGEVRVKLRRVKGCACVYIFMLAVLAERELSKLSGVERASVEVVL
jgi:metal-sulfur cluster biosynthetic enzyme